MLDHNWNHALLKQNHFNTEKTDETIQQSGKHNSSRHTLKSPASMFQSSDVQEKVIHTWANLLLGKKRFTG